MAKTKRDSELHARIRALIKTLEERGESEKDIIYCVAGTCHISHRTASEQYKAFKAQKTFEGLGIDLKKECVHEWSNYFSTPGGLARECRLCGKTELREK